MSRGGGSLTGGTGDVNPQYATINAVESAADTTTTTTTPIPIQRLQNKGRAMVLEVLKIFIDFNALPAIASAAETIRSISVFLSTTSFGTTNATWADPRVFAYCTIANRGAFTAAGSFWGTLPTLPYLFDLTDSAGHGLLVATDNIFTQVQSVATGAVQSVRVKILYRWKDVSITEYVGIVQSQQ